MGDRERVESLDSSIPLERLTGVLERLTGVLECSTGVLDPLGGVWSSLVEGVWSTGLDWVSGTGKPKSILRCNRAILDINSSKLAWLMLLGRNRKSKLLTSETMEVSCTAAGVVPAGIPWATGSSSLAESSTAESCGCAESAPAGSCSCAGSATHAELSTISGSSSAAESWFPADTSPAESWTSAESVGPVTSAESAKAAESVGPSRLPGRPPLLAWEAAESLWWFSSRCLWCRLVTTGPHVWTRKTTQTSPCPHSHVFHDDDETRTWTYDQPMTEMKRMPSSDDANDEWKN